MKLLVSVSDKDEAVEAVRGKADILDVKNPREGSLGANFPWVIKEVSDVSNNVEISATLGDLPNLPGTAALAALGAASVGVNYVKVGLYGPRTVDDGVQLMRGVCRTLRDYRPKVKIIVAGYADFRKVHCLNPLKLPEVAWKVGADGVLIDIKVKGIGKLFDFFGENVLNSFVNEAHNFGLIVGLAGSLDFSDVARVWRVDGDIIGVRGVVCAGGDRLGGKIQESLVNKMAGMVRECH
ncbi:MAG: (5-formylfuran-3-yl)methyl phosphate synthase [Candidatus Bathyarchaeota archaeon]